MPVQMFPDGLEPTDPSAVIWRLMSLEKFTDLISSSALYFRRADKFESDEEEGLPPEDYLPHAGLNPLDIHDAIQLNNFRGSLAQGREAFFISCWCISTEPTIRMWGKYAKYGIAIGSRYGLLKYALNSCQSKLGAFLGMVRYGSKHLTGWNVLRFISTKREKFTYEQEVRALLWIPDEFSGNNRHFDENNIPHDRPLTEPPSGRVPLGFKRVVDLPSFITEVQVSPWASKETLAETEHLIRESRYSIPVYRSSFTRFKDLIATEDDLPEILRTDTK
jgi:hypothetical protein